MPAGVAGVLLGRLHDGAAVLHGCGLDGLRVLRHDRAGLIRVVTVGESGVRHPRGAAGRTGTCLRFSWRYINKEKENETYLFRNFQQRSISKYIYGLLKQVLL